MILSTVIFREHFCLKNVRETAKNQSREQKQAKTVREFRLALQDGQQIGGVRGIRGLEALLEAVEAVVYGRFVAA